MKTGTAYGEVLYILLNKNCCYFSIYFISSCKKNTSLHIDNQSVSLDFFYFPKCCECNWLWPELWEVKEFTKTDIVMGKERQIY